MNTHIKIIPQAFTIILTFALMGCAQGAGEISALVSASPTLQIVSVSPTSSPTAGGSTLTIRGTLFQSGLSIMIGATFCGTVNFISTTEVRCQLPAKTAGTYNITVTNTDGGSTTLNGGITYADVLGPPSVTSVSPNNGSTNGNTAVTIAGTQFQTGATVLFDNVSCTNVNVVSANSITCTTPAHAAGLVNITVTNPDAQTNTLTGGYTYVVPPTFTSLKTNPLNTCTSCHGFNDYATVMARVTPGNPAASTLYTRVADNTMPQGGPPLSAEQKKKIFDWIMDGAPNN